MKPNPPERRRGGPPPTALRAGLRHAVPALAWLLAAALPAPLHAATEDAATPASGLRDLLAQTEAATAAVPCRPQRASLPELLAQLPACENDAPFLAQLGFQLNQLRRYAEALDHLERALLLDPSLQRAQVDYAVALAGSGDMVASLALVRSLLTEPTLPAELRPALAQQERRMAALLEPALGLRPLGQTAPYAPTAATGSATGRSWRRTATLRLGRDSNLLGSPDLRSLTLTLPDLAVTLPLEDNFAAQSGAYARGDLLVEMRQPGEGGLHYDLRGALQASASPALPQSNARQYEIGFERGRSPMSLPVADGGTGEQPASEPQFDTGHYLQVAYGGLDTNTGVRYQNLSAGAGIEGARRLGFDLGLGLQRQACVWRLGGELQNRTLSSSPTLSGRYAGLSAQWRCVGPTGVVWQASAQIGRDWPSQMSRPGGQQNQQSWRLSGLLPVGSLGFSGNLSPADSRTPQRTLQLDLDLFRSRDRTGYSPLLANGAVRRVQRYSLRLEWNEPLQTGWAAQFGASWTHQNANIVLFRQRNWGPYLALRHTW